jgi:hypothetical protein
VTACGTRAAAEQGDQDGRGRSSLSMRARPANKILAAIWNFVVFLVRSIRSYG